MKRRGAVKQNKERTLVNITEETLLNDLNRVLILLNFLKRNKYDVPIGDKHIIKMPSDTRNNRMQIVPNTAPRSNSIKEEKK